MKRLLPLAILALWTLFLFSGFGPTDKAYIRSVKKHRKQVHKSFKDPESSPFKDQAHSYTRLSYFPPDPAYRVSATISRTPEADPFHIQTSNPDRQKQFVSYGQLQFDLNGAAYSLTVYRNLELPGIPLYKNHLFLLFTDESSGRDTYGGGRYLDLEIPETGNEIVLDFNMCYNPYCAYGEGWSCPIPPSENHLPIRIEAGVKKYHD